jgi:hypothetical protein
MGIGRGMGNDDGGSEIGFGESFGVTWGMAIYDVEACIYLT